MTDTAETFTLSLHGLDVCVVRKQVKNLHLGVYPPDGRVRVAAPLALSSDAVRLAVIGKLGWIRAKQARFAAQPRQSERDMARGESHYYLGRRYRLRIVPYHFGTPTVVPRPGAILQLAVREGTTPEGCGRTLERWYRERMREIVPPLIARWEERLGVTVAEWGIKRMKTRWGTCTIAARRIWLNSELIKKPPVCIEYVVLHEMLHLLERHHNARFTALLDQHLPHWRRHKDALNAAPLGHETWE